MLTLLFLGFLSINYFAFYHLTKDIYPPAFFKKKRQGYCNHLHTSVRPSVTLSPPKPLDEIQPNLVCELLA